MSAGVAVAYYIYYTLPTPGLYSQFFDGEHGILSNYLMIPVPLRQSFRVVNTIRFQIFNYLFRIYGTKLRLQTL